MDTRFSLGASLVAATSILARRIAVPLLTLSAGLALVQPCAGQSGSFSYTGSLAGPRALHTATLLQNGKVLVAGGSNSTDILASAELYDPASGTWKTTGGLNAIRESHTATLLSNGKVLVVGGQGTNGYLASAELYDPASGTWKTTGSLAHARISHTATLLSNGKVLVAAGFNSSTGAFPSAELYDPASGTWTETGSLITGRYYHSATLLQNGKVLVASGSDNNGPIASAELYDPASKTWTATGDLLNPRPFLAATRLTNGKVLVSGGVSPFNSNLSSAELYNPASGTWAATGSMAAGRSHHTMTLLANGEVLVVGGPQAELYDPSSGNWTATGSPGAARSEHTATLLQNGKVLVAGGYYGSYLASAELYDLPMAPPRLLNISTRLPVGTGDNALIGGFIVTGKQPKKVIVRGIGPSLPFRDGDLANPTLELRNGSGQVVASNNNWKDTQQAAVQATGIAPSNDLESAIAASLPANNASYTAILRGLSDTTGIGLIEAYDLDQAADSQLANISTRGFVGTGDRVLIAGFICGPGTKVIVRAIGPSLTGVDNPLLDPTLQLRDGNGAVVRANDNWKDTQQAAIQATGIAPTNNRESALIETLNAGNYTATVRGAGSTTGIGLVEIYNLQ